MSDSEPKSPAKGPGRPRAKVDENQCTREGCTNQKAWPDTTNPWCAQCWAEYLGRYNKGRDARCFSAGVRAMKEAIASQMAHYGGAVFTGAEVAGMVRAIDTSLVEK